jgi:Flp pilus assembly protein TadB
LRCAGELAKEKDKKTKALEGAVANLSATSETVARSISARLSTNRRRYADALAQLSSNEPGYCHCRRCRCRRCRRHRCLVIITVVVVTIFVVVAIFGIIVTIAVVVTVFALCRRYHRCRRPSLAYPR